MWSKKNKEKLTKLSHFCFVLLVNLRFNSVEFMIDNRLWWPGCNSVRSCLFELQIPQ